MDLSFDVTIHLLDLMNFLSDFLDFLLSMANSVGILDMGKLLLQILELGLGSLILDEPLFALVELFVLGRHGLGHGRGVRYSF